MRTAHDTYNACKPAARKACATKLPAELFDCLTTTVRACNRAHSAQTESCRTNFIMCYSACGLRPEAQIDFWCELDVDEPSGGGMVYKDGFCGGTPRRAPEDRYAECKKLFVPTDPATGFSLTCDQLP